MTGVGLELTLLQEHVVRMKSELFYNSGSVNTVVQLFVNTNKYSNIKTNQKITDIGHFKFLNFDVIDF